MDAKELSRFVALRETHAKVLGGYRGKYSLGVGQDPSRGRGPVLVLSVQLHDDAAFPSEVQVNGETVPVVVRTGYQSPRALSH